MKLIKKLLTFICNQQSLYGDDNNFNNTALLRTIDNKIKIAYRLLKIELTKKNGNAGYVNEILDRVGYNRSKAGMEKIKEEIGEFETVVMEVLRELE